MGIIIQVVLIGLFLLVYDYLVRLSVGLSIGAFTRKIIKNTTDSIFMMKRAAIALMFADFVTLLVGPVGAFFILWAATEHGIDPGNSNIMLIVYVLFKVEILRRSWQAWQRLRAIPQ